MGASIGPWANIEVIACRTLQNGHPSGFDVLRFVSFLREFPYKIGYQGYWTKVSTSRDVALSFRTNS